MKSNDRTIVPIVCDVVLIGERGREDVTAKVDTGASRTSVDTDLAARVGLGPVTDTVKVRAASSAQAEVRPLVEARIQLAGKEFMLPVSIADRADMNYPVIIGMDILSEGNFLIDVSNRTLNGD
ncbi:MAG: RimK/LysX family protein [Thermoplasmata archaeon]|nr:RimK/LysX family protein [Thermoplasmata archaeon]